MTRITTRQDGPHVLLLVDGRLVAEMPWNAALDVSRAIHVKAKAAEEIAKAAGIIYDHAILMRHGFRFGLTSHPLLQGEAAKQAAWNRNLRRYIPGGVRSEEMVGTPSLILHPPQKKED